MRYTYLWYHFGLDSVTIDAIEDSIADGDYDTFMKYKNKYPENLPDTILCSPEEDPFNYSSVDVNDKDNFMKINFSEHENG